MTFVPISSPTASPSLSPTASPSFSSDLYFKKTREIIGMNSYDKFGSTVLIDGNTLYVSSSGYDSNKGAVFIYNNTNQLLPLVSRSLIEVLYGSHNNSYFGYSMNIIDIITTKILVIGACGYEDNSGIVYIYSSNDASSKDGISKWILNQDLQSNIKNSYFGWSIASITNSSGEGQGSQYLDYNSDNSIIISYIAIGSPFYSSMSGTVYIYKKIDNLFYNTTSNFELHQQIMYDTTDGGAGLFGFSLSFSNEFLVIGANLYNEGSGAAYVYKLTPWERNSDWLLEKILLGVIIY
jgi:hypothetical protein